VGVQSVRNNLRFLREFCADGYTVAGFCRTLPCVPMECGCGPKAVWSVRHWTPIIASSIRGWMRSGTSRSSPLRVRNYGKDATWDRLRGLLFEARLDYPDRPHDPDYRMAAQTLTAASNTLLLDIAEEAVDYLEDAPVPDAADPILLRLARFSREEDERIRGTLNALWSARPRMITAELFR
jgi:hypothetical protein